MDRNAMLRTAALMLACLWMPAWADTFESPRIKSYLSGDGRYRLTVTPSSDSSPRPKRNIPPAMAAQARMERRQGTGWAQVWRGPLRNPVAPAWALVSDGGRVATFDDWYGAGHGDHVVVLYDPAGRTVRALRLEQLLPADYVRALPRSISSIHWGRGHEFSADGRRLLLRMGIPSYKDRGLEPAGYVELALDATTGRRAAGYETALQRAYVRAAPAIAREQLRWEVQKAVQRTPLQAPTAGDYLDWNRYLSEAYRRMDLDGHEGSPQVLQIQMQAGRADPLELRRMIEALSNPGNATRALMFASPSEQDGLIAALAEAAQKAPPRRLVGRRVYVLVDDKGSAAAAAALARTGATYVQLNPSRPIEQRREVLRELERD